MRGQNIFFISKVTYLNNFGLLVGYFILFFYCNGLFFLGFFFYNLNHVIFILISRKFFCLVDFLIYGSKFQAYKVASVLQVSRVTVMFNVWIVLNFSLVLFCSVLEGETACQGECLIKIFLLITISTYC